jgi:hypothetical protein
MVNLLKALASSKEANQTSPAAKILQLVPIDFGQANQHSQVHFSSDSRQGFQT